MSAHLTKDLLLSSMLETDSAESKKVTQLLDISSFQTESRLAFVTKQNAESESQKTDDENFPGKATSSPSLNSGDVDATTLSAVLAQNSNTKASVPSSPNRSPSTLKTLSFREQPLPQPLAPSSTASSLTQQLQMHRRSQGSGPPPGTYPCFMFKSKRCANMDSIHILAPCDIASFMLSMTPFSFY